MWNFLHRLASPPHFYDLSAKMIPWFVVPGLGLIAYGTYAGLFMAPEDYQQGDAFRIIYVHVPSAYLSMMTYMIMAVSAGIGLIWRIKLSHAVAAAAAPIGAWFTFLALITGIDLGAADVGNLVGVGRSKTHVPTDHAVHILRLHGIAVGDR